MLKRPTKRKNTEFWVTNINQKRDVALGDLRVTIRAGKSVNLLDKRHYDYTLQQLKESAKSGSIYKKSKFIKVRELAPVKPVQPGIYEVNQTAYSRKLRLGERLPKSVEVDYKQYEELGDAVSKDELRKQEEEFAAEEADAVLDDRVPALSVDEIYKKKVRDDSDN